MNTDDALFTWGDNGFGQLGNGTLAAFSLEPIVINCTALNVAEQNTQTISIYPNPVKTELYLQLSSGNTIESAIVTDLTGKTILQQMGDFNQINVQYLASGLYMLTTQTTDKTFCQKFIKE